MEDYYFESGSTSKNGSGFRIMEPSIFPTSVHMSERARYSSTVMYPQSRAKSSEESVSLISPSQSVSLLRKWAGYRRFAHASRRFKQTDRDDLRIWLVKAYRSSGGNRLVT